MKTPVHQNMVKQCNVVDKDNNLLAICYTKDTASELVKIINAHEKMVAAIDHALLLIRDRTGYYQKYLDERASVISELEKALESTK